MNATEPPRIVLEQPSACADAARAEDALRRALAASRAPAAGWTVTMRVERAHGELRGAGEITDASGSLVAERSIDANECGAIARAMGLWASLVLDDETSRSEAAKPKPAPAPAPASLAAAWPAPAPPEKSNAEAATFLMHEPDERTFEIGVSSQLMMGTGAGMIAGISVFTVSEVANGWFLRPAIQVGRTATEIASTSDVYATWGAARFDACKRLPGNYLERRGIQLDLCGGADMGFLHFDLPTPGEGAAAATGLRTTPFVAVGPSLAFRGELGSDLSVWVRAVGELNVLPTSFVDGTGTNVEPSLLLGRAEVGLSWRLR